MTGGKWGRSNRFSHWDHNNIPRILVKLRSFVFVIINHHITYCRNFSLNLLSTESSNSFANRSAVQCWKILVMHCHHNRSVGCNFANPTIWSRDRNGTRPPSQTTHNSYTYISFCATNYTNIFSPVQDKIIIAKHANRLFFQHSSWTFVLHISPAISEYTLFSYLRTRRATQSSLVDPIARVKLPPRPTPMQ